MVGEEVEMSGMGNFLFFGMGNFGGSIWWDVYEVFREKGDVIWF